MADHVTRLDDLHLKEGRQVAADQRYEFSLIDDNGSETTYRLDLDMTHAAEWEKAISPFLDAATPIVKEASKVASSPRTPKRRTTPSGNASRRTSKETTAQIRQWADDNGIELKPKGPLPGEIKQRYADAMGVDVASLT